MFQGKKFNCCTIFLWLIAGVDGDPTAEYKVLYKGEKSSFDVEDLYSDYLKGWLKFTFV